MIAAPALLMLAAVAGQAPAAGAPAQPSMIVSADQFGDALGRCRDQLARPAFAVVDLTGAGWLPAASVAGSATGPALAMYRHPTTMLLVTLVDHADKPDQCAVMVPFGPLLDAAAADRRVSDFAASAPRGGNRWTTDHFDIAREPMGSAGARYLFTKKARE